MSPEPAGVFVADYNGRKRVPAYGCPVFSLGEPYYAETMLPKGYKVVLDWFQEVARQPNYENPKFERFDFGGSDDEEEIDEIPWNATEKLNSTTNEDRIVKVEDATEDNTTEEHLKASDNGKTAADINCKNNKENAK